MANFEGHINLHDGIVTIQGLYRDDGKEDGNYRYIYGIIGTYKNHGKDKGSYHIIGLYRGYILCYILPEIHECQGPSKRDIVRSSRERLGGSTLTPLAVENSKHQKTYLEVHGT